MNDLPCFRPNVSRYDGSNLLIINSVDVISLGLWRINFSVTENTKATNIEMVLVASEMRLKQCREIFSWLEANRSGAC